MSNTPALPAPADVATALASSLNTKAQAILAIPRIENPEDDEVVSQVARAFKAAQQLVKTERAKSTELRRLANQFDQPWRPVDQLCTRVIEHAKSLILGRRRRAEEEQRALLEKIVETGASHEEIARSVEATATERPSGFIEREVWTYEITDESAIPKEYYVLDTQRIAREARALKGSLAIPGIRAIREIKGTLR